MSSATAWLTPWHPDPRGDNLRLLATALKLMVEDKYDHDDEAPDELRTYAVIIDFCSAHQKGNEASNGMRWRMPSSTRL